MSYVPFQHYKDCAVRMAGYLSVRILDRESPNSDTSHRVFHKMTIEGDPMTSIQSARIETYLTYSKALLMSRNEPLDGYMLVTTERMYRERTEFWFGKLNENQSMHDDLDIFNGDLYPLRDCDIFYIKRGEPQYLIDLPMPFLDAVKPGLTVSDVLDSVQTKPPANAAPLEHMRD